MTVTEFRLFFDALPEEDDMKRPSKRTFARECGIALSSLKQMAIGKAPFSEPRVNQILPVMRKYGFQG